MITRGRGAIAAKLAECFDRLGLPAEDIVAEAGAAAIAVQPTTAEPDQRTAASIAPAAAASPPPARRRRRPVDVEHTSHRHHVEAMRVRRAADEATWQARQLERQQRANKSHRDTLQRVWPLEVVRMATAILCDPSGQACIRHLGAAAKRFSGAPIWAITRAALGVRDSQELEGAQLRLRVRRTWRSPRAQAVVVYGLALLYCSRGNKRSGQWTRTTRGFSISNYCALLKSPYASSAEKAPNRSTISGTRRNRGQAGYLRSLEATGFCYRTQLPAASVEAWEIGRRTGRAYNRYSIVGMARKVTFATRMRLEAWHRAGWSAADAVLSLDALEPASAAPA